MLIVVWHLSLSLTRDHMGLVERHGVTSEHRLTAWTPPPFPVSFPVLFLAPIIPVLIFVAPPRTCRAPRIIIGMVFLVLV